MTSAETPAPPALPARPRWRRRMAKVVGGLLFLAILAVLAFPWILGTQPARRWMLVRANRFLAPGGLDVGSFQFSWFGPTRMTGFAIIDPQGERVVDAPQALWDRNLAQILFGGPKHGTLTLDHASLDIERGPDGSVDLAEALRALFDSPPEEELQIRIVDGTVRVRDPALATPLAAEKAVIDIVRPAAPGLITWRISLGSGSGESAPELAIRGSFDRWGPTSPDGSRDLIVDVSGEAWPLDLNVAGCSVKGAYSGALFLHQQAGLARIGGRGNFRSFDLTTPSLAGDHLKLPELAARWELERSAAKGLAVTDLDLSAGDLFSLRNRGTIPPPPGQSGRIDGELNLAALARQIPHALRLQDGIALNQGTATLRIQSSSNAGRQAWDVEARVADLVAARGDSTVTLRDPATLTARLVGDRSDLSLASFSIKTPFLTATGSGEVDRGIELTGSVNLGGLERQLRDVIDFRTLHFSGEGPLLATYRRNGTSFEGVVKLDLKGLDLQGLGPWELHRDLAQVDSAFRGPMADSGLPRSLSSARLKLTSGGAVADLVADIKDSATDLSISARLPFSGGNHRGAREAYADARILGRLDDRQLKLDEVRLLVANDVEGVAPPLHFAAKGRYDRPADSLVLMPLGEVSGALALAPEGLTATGFTTTFWNCDLALVGDVAAAMRAWELSSGAASSSDVTGRWSARLSAKSAQGDVRIGGRIEARDLSIVEGPVALAVQGVYRRPADRLDISEFVLSSNYATVEAAGSVDDVRDKFRVDVRGSLTPDWKVLNALLARRVEPRAHLSGQPRPFRIHGPLAGDSTDPLDFEAGFDMTEADIYGMKFGPTPIVLRRQRGETFVDPIETTLNNGRIRLEPKIVSMRDKGTAVVLGPTSWISGAEVNDEVSRRVLAFAAPILEDATRVRGKVSAEIRHAEFPLVADAAHRAVVEGDVVFRDVEFAPGPLAEELLMLLNRRDPALRLDHPVHLAMANGRIETKGLVLPLGKVTEIALDGSVGFDRTLALRASVPVTSAMLGNTVVGDIFDGARVTVPIGGTLSKPKIDRDAFRIALQDTGKDILRRGMTRGALELLNRMSRPRDPNAPPPPPRLTPRERRERRAEQRKTAQRDQEP
jgi:translocation and assembly module TamB